MGKIQSKTNLLGGWWFQHASNPPEKRLKTNVASSPQFESCTRRAQGQFSRVPSLQVHQREAQALARGLAIGPLGEDVAELRIRELVDGPLQATAEVAPAITSGFFKVLKMLRCLKT